MIKKGLSRYILAIGSIQSVCFSLLCLTYILYLPYTAHGIKTLNAINTLGLLAQRSIVLCAFIALAYDIIKINAKGHTE